jgi:hypothetical protein
MTIVFKHLKNVPACAKVQAYEQHLESLEADVRVISRPGLLQPDAIAMGAFVPPPLNPQGVLQLCLLGSPMFQDTPHEQSVWDHRMNPAELVECEHRHELIEAWAKHLLTYEETCNAIKERWSIQSRMRGSVADGLRFARDVLLRLKEQGITYESPKLKRRRIEVLTKALETALLIVTELDDKDYQHLKWDLERRPFAKSPLDYLQRSVRQNSKPYKVLLWNMRDDFKKYRPGENGKRYPDQAMFYAMAEVLFHVGIKNATTVQSFARTIQKELWDAEHPRRRVKTAKTPSRSTSMGKKS